MAEYIFRARKYQRAFHEAMVNRTHDRLIAVWHRRAGKDEVVLNAMRDLASIDPGTYWHCFPEQAQARKAIWNGVNGKTGQRRIFDIFPKLGIKRMQDDDMFIELKNNSTFQLIGSDRYDSTVGAGPKGVAYSEWALSNPAAWAYHQPMIRESKGFAAFITTPRGDNHAKTMLDKGMKDPKWFAQILTASDTEALSQADLDEALDEYQALWGLDMGLALFEQEYLCSFSGAMIGAYFGSEVSRAERAGRFKVCEVDPSRPVHTAWDLGATQNNPVWCFQVIKGDLVIVDLYMPDSDNLADWIAWLNSKGYNGTDYVPHDIMVTEWGSGKTRIETMREMGRKPKRIPRVSVADGLQAGRVAINSASFHQGDDDRSDRVKHGIDGLRSYRREWDQDLKTFRANPVKDWSEHIGSAWRYLGLSWKEEADAVIIAKPKEVVYTALPNGLMQSNVPMRDQINEFIKRRKRE